VEAIRAVIVRDTRHVQEFLATAPLGEALAERSDVEILSQDRLVFSSRGTFQPPWEHEA
jgi:hypothetical protein